ncbi:hypothetical protein OO013_05120 [Mangrovivirga sp. M17]|uniref:Lipocalin-like domain-containing protein n=1 Tax=Mangrovivirga halotolerans TaxID=2993936 RepID=A0ABT3RN51_9BACT|nr:hypothetical protein [Mangrovivirga halotolerans]MCX2743234.1 hypothetical protein [Mangrovivirga halotolerans]
MNLSKLLPVFFLSLIIFSSCSDDEAGATIQPEAAPGEWKLQDLDYASELYISTVDAESGQTVESKFADVTGELKESTMFITFDDQTDPNTCSATGSYTLTLTTKVAGITMDTSDETFTSFEGLLNEWRIEGNKIIFTSLDGSETEGTINKLTETEFIIQTSMENEGDFLGDGSTARTVVDLTLYLTKNPA